MILAVAFSPDGGRVVTGCSDGTAIVWDTASGAPSHRFTGHTDDVTAAAFSPDGTMVLTAGWDHVAILWDARSGRELQRFRGHASAILSVAFSPNGKYAATGSMDKTTILWELSGARSVQRFPNSKGAVQSVAFSPDSSLLLAGTRDGAAVLWDVGAGRAVRTIQGHQRTVYTVAFSPTGTQFLTGGLDRSAVVWDGETGGKVAELRGHTSAVTSAVFLGDWGQVATASLDGTAAVWDAKNGTQVCRLVHTGNDGWCVIRPDGRFDCRSLEGVRGLSWVMSDTPLRPLPVEIFMRDYFQPRLLTHAFEKKLPAVRPLGGLNRVQPGVKIVQVAPGADPDIATVTVEVTRVEETFRRDGRDVTRATDAYDPRLFRDGQLVGQWPEPRAGAPEEYDPATPEGLRAWQKSGHIPPGAGGRLLRTFPVRLPRGAAGAQVQFTAYAFNEDRVKSMTAGAPYNVPKGLPAARPRAYLVCVGVSAFTNPAWDLRFAASDARRTARAMEAALRPRGEYDVVPLVLTAERTPSGAITEAATKANLQAALDLLAGKVVKDADQARLPGARQLRPAAPDDLVVLFVSSHGYTDDRGVYYLYPTDIGPGRGREVTPDLLRRCVSSTELAGWLRGVDAGQLVLVVDCCHAAATVEQPGFKPGPMGSNGLGQLAYDKGMRVLAASQADDVALESGQIRQGLLTYALVRDGLEKGRAVQDDTLTLGHLLRYAERRVPVLYQEVLKGEVKGANGQPEGTRVLVARGGEIEPLGGAGLPTNSSLRKPRAFQTPALFEYSWGNKDVVLETGR
jgi:hypothetical protein